MWRRKSSRKQSLFLGNGDTSQGILSPGLASQSWSSGHRYLVRTRPLPPLFFRQIHTTHPVLTHRTFSRLSLPKCFNESVKHHGGARPKHKVSLELQSSPVLSHGGCCSALESSLFPGLKQCIHSRSISTLSTRKGFKLGIGETGCCGFAFYFPEWGEL